MVCTLWKVVTVHLYFGNDMVGLITKSLLHCICISGPFNLPDATIKRISNLKEVPVPTLEVKVKIKCRYCCLVLLFFCLRCFGLWLGYHGDLAAEVIAALLCLQHLSTNTSNQLG